jgi:hypothetical protein
MEEENERLIEGKMMAIDDEMTSQNSIMSSGEGSRWDTEIDMPMVLHI